MSEDISVETTNSPAVSKSWNEKFQLLSRIGADEKFIYKAMNTAKFKRLRFSEKQKVSFNILAFLFGPFYYLCKKMWAKAAVIFAANWIWVALLLFAENIFEITIPGVVYWIPCAVVCAQLANYDYFRRILYGEKMWSGIPNFFAKPSGAITAPLVALAIVVLAATLNISQAMALPECDDVNTTSLVSQIVGNAGFKFVSLNSIVEQGYNEHSGIRACHATLITKQGMTELQYSVEWRNKNKGKFYVAVQ